MAGNAQFQYSGSELDALQSAKNYYRWIAQQFRPYLGEVVAEVGAGIGTFSEVILAQPKVRKLFLLEPAGNAFPALAKFAEDKRVETLNCYLSDWRSSYALDSLVAVNVMEHIEDDEAFLADAWTRVAAGGHLLLLVPAVQAIFGSLDERFEHYRRYSKAELSSRVTMAGWDIVRVEYLNLPGVLSWFMASRVFRKTNISRFEVSVYDRFILPLTLRIEALWPPPIGQNLVLIAQKPISP